MGQAWPLLLLIVCFFSLRFAPPLIPASITCRSWLRLLGYGLIAAAIVVSAFDSIDGGYGLSSFLAGPANYFSLPAALLITLGIALLLALFEADDSGEDSDGGDDKDDFDPWGPDFDEARARWQRGRVEAR